MISLFERYMSIVEKNCRNKNIVEEIRQRMRDEQCFDEPADIEEDIDDYPFLDAYDDGLAVMRQMKKDKNWQDVRDVTCTGMEPELRVMALQVFYEDKNPFPQSERISTENLQGMYGRTKLHNAVLLEDLDAISELMESGVNYSLKDNNGMDALTLAILEGKVKSYKLLKELLGET